MGEAMMPRAISTLALLVLAAAPLHAASITYYLDQSNTEGTWPDGVDYLSVTVSDSLSNPGDIEILVTPLAALTVSAGANFGIQAFGFNSIHTLTAANVVDPAGWSFGSGNMDGFGAYQVQEAGTGGTRQNPLLLRITGVGGDAPADYAIAGAGGAQGTYAFTAHVAGMSVGPGSAYFGGDTVVPVPAAAWLLGPALGALGVLRRRARQAGLPSRPARTGAGFTAAPPAPST